MSSSTVPVHGEVYSCYWYNDVRNNGKRDCQCQIKILKEVA